MENTPIPAERTRDPAGYDRPGHGRDPARTPMQWNTDTHAGFSRAEPWLPVAPDYAERNVERAQADPRSLLQLYRRLIALRGREPALRIGSYVPVEASEDVLAYLRHDRSGRFLVALNFNRAPRRLELPHALRGRIVLATGLDREEERVEAALNLQPSEGVLVRLADD